MPTETPVIQVPSASGQTKAGQFGDFTAPDRLMTLDQWQKIHWAQALGLTSPLVTANLYTLPVIVRGKPSACMIQARDTAGNPDDLGSLGLQDALDEFGDRLPLEIMTAYSLDGITSKFMNSALFIAALQQAETQNALKEFLAVQFA
jgi:hypothetical protein